jgi:predicted transglutaminase-like cysteine proteinase
LLFSPTLLSEATAETDSGLKQAVTPAGWIGLCERQPGMCARASGVVVVPKAGEEEIKQLNEINRTVNHRIAYVTDREQLGSEEFWGFPSTGRGDCEDYVLENRERLIKLGWSRSALLKSVVVAKNQQWHAVLAVHTVTGFYILDNMTDDVLAPEQTGHRFFSRQSMTHPSKWLVWPNIEIAGPNSSGKVGASTH